MRKVPPPSAGAATGASLPAQDGPGTEACDAQTLADLAEAFGPERLGRMLGELDAEIVRRLAAARPRDPALGGDAHVLVSVSGALGFMDLSRACAALERAILAGSDPAAPLEGVRREAGRARRAIAALRAA